MCMCLKLPSYPILRQPSSFPSSRTITPFAFFLSPPTVHPPPPPSLSLSIECKFRMLAAKPPLDILTLPPPSSATSHSHLCILGFLAFHFLTWPSFQSDSEGGGEGNFRTRCFGNYNSGVDSFLLLRSEVEEAKADRRDCHRHTYTY